ncbi:BRO-N domain-containing protein [Glaesserella parasuis]|uniref:BRO-N domain-containing protein n=2 Tax=Glaesserella parasuis TaxID=738 RepID=UPI0021BD8B2A|nr:BRO family protein [Glaesserella parasuis]MCT8526837.1 hypothetical protein [Glaesserella parasuis]MCT8528939.1 hypothetical protein [Glaesserella parasuis]MCT8531066.1 hypothetical protein [Glaesserella parasuis]MCT8532936.1 hypothetical protein [Glaesserella parasuis]MCT8543740.1 hypothetical protein [Glaesserella parasuis]
MSQSTQLSTFNFEQSSIRVIAVNNEPWFVAKDVCDTLGIKNPTQALENLDEDERAMFNIGLEQRVNFDNRVSEINIVSESGMYTLILRCRDAVKKGSVPHRFRKWVTAEVLPQIRKTGQYSQNSTQIAPLTITPEQQRAIQEAVQQAHYRTGLHWKEIYSRLKSTFNVAKYDQLPQTMFEHVINFLNTLGNQYRPIDRSKKDITIAGLDAEQIAKYLVRARAFAKEVEVFHRKLYEDLGISRYVKNDIAGKAYDIAHEFNVWLDPFIEQALPQLNQQRLARF